MRNKAWKKPRRPVLCIVIRDAVSRYGVRLLADSGPGAGVGSRLGIIMGGGWDLGRKPPGMDEGDRGVTG